MPDRAGAFADDRRLDRLRSLRMAGRLVAALLLRRPLYAQLVVTNRCNLSCGYCTEYDHSSSPIPFDALSRRIDALHRLGTVLIGMHGGEPLLHPDLPKLVAHASRYALVSVTTNGFLLTDEHIDALNQAGLLSMQVSIDGLTPDRTLYIQKSLKTVRRRLLRLKERARFRVFVNLVLSEASRPDFRQMVEEVRAMGLPLAVGLLHDDLGQVAVTGPGYAELYAYYRDRFASADLVGYAYNARLLRGEQPRWRCLAGGRYLYVDPAGQVRLCPARPGRIDRPVVEYTATDVRASFAADKGCEASCAMMCAYRPSALDNQPLDTLAAMVRAGARQALAAVRGMP